jgi:hypothetical protein
MKPLLAPLAIALLSFNVTACGEADQPTRSTSKSASNTATTVSNAEGSHITTTATGIVYDGDDGPIRFYGHEAGAADKQAITTLVRRYYAVAAKKNGTAGCALLASLTADTIPEDYEELTGPHARTCPAIMFKLFDQRHQELVRDNTTLEVISVRIEGNRALALLRFAKASEPNHVSVHREGPTWKIWEIFANHMP